MVFRDQLLKVIFMSCFNTLSSYQLAYKGIHVYKNNLLWVMSVALRSSEMEN